MTSGGAPPHDNGSRQGHWSQDRVDSAFGPQGAALLGELRRIQGASDTRVGRPLPENAHPEVRSSPSILRLDAKARRPAEQTGETIRRESISNIHDLRFSELRPSRRTAERGFRSSAPADPPTRSHRREALGLGARAGKASAGRVVRASLERLGMGYGWLVGHLGAPNAADVDGPDLAGRLRRGFQDELRAGLRVLVLGVGIVGGWAVVMPLSAAVMVAGTLVVESDVKKVQHPTGGVIAQILVHDGMHVKEGELVARLNEIQVGANLQVIMKQLDETRMRIARLTAERDGMDEPKLPRELATRTGDKDIEQLIMSENSLFKARAGARHSQKELLRGHVGQLGEEIEGLKAQIKSKGTQLDLIASELRGVQALYDKQLVPLTRLTALQREAARLDGEREQLVSATAETRSKISEAELQVIRIDQDLRAEVTKDLRESQDKESELTERSVAAQDQMNRIDLRAPTSGVVHQLAVHTIGGVIGPAEVIMEIVPDSDNLQVQARLSPKDIDQVLMGQKTLVRLSAFNQRTTPQLNGVVSYVSADLSHDKQTDAAYYTLRVTLPGAELRRLGDLQLVSGMPAELFLQTGSRTMMSYLLKPITEQMQRTFSER
jgi:HlyD family secretion protein